MSNTNGAMIYCISWKYKVRLERIIWWSKNILIQMKQLRPNSYC